MGMKENESETNSFERDCEILLSKNTMSDESYWFIPSLFPPISIKSQSAITSHRNRVCPVYDRQCQHLFSTVHADGTPYYSTNDLLSPLGAPATERLTFATVCLLLNRNSVWSAPVNPAILFLRLDSFLSTRLFLSFWFFLPSPSLRPARRPHSVVFFSSFPSFIVPTPPPPPPRLQGKRA